MPKAITYDIFGTLIREKKLRIPAIRGDSTTYWQRHGEQYSMIEGYFEFNALCEKLHDRSTDARGLQACWRELAAKERENPSSTTLESLIDWDESKVAGAMKLLQRVFRKSRQEPEPSDIEYVPALSQVAIELIVSSLYRTLHPLITHRFHRHTVNSRTEAGRRRGLQRTQELASADSRFVWVRATLSDPYKHVDQELLLIALWNVFGNKKLYRLLEDCVRDSSRKGLVPTAPLCHLLKEFFIDWYVVRIWRLEHRRVPLIRDSNEILILAKSPAEGEVFKNAFKKLLASSQLPVCSPAGITVHDLGSGEEATWLRRRISRRGGKWIVK